MKEQTLSKMLGLDTKTIDVEGIKAEFVNQLDGSCDVVVEINSQKFLIQFSRNEGLIEKFEIVAVKGFITNLTNGLVFALKNLVEHLCLSLN